MHPLAKLYDKLRAAPCILQRYHLWYDKLRAAPCHAITWYDKGLGGGSGLGESGGGRGGDGDGDGSEGLGGGGEGEGEGDESGGGGGASGRLLMMASPRLSPVKSVGPLVGPFASTPCSPVR